MPITKNDPTQTIKRAAELLRQGELVAIPTETVYGLAALVDNQTAIKKVYAVKNRPSEHPLIVHIGTEQQLYRYAKQVPDYVQSLIKNFWPGPLTLVLEKSDAVDPLITGNQNTVAIRMPNHPLALKLIQDLDQGVVAPSANKFKHISPTSAQHVIDDLGEEIFILDGGSCSIGIESTIIDATDPKQAYILRPGKITAQEIETLLNKHAVSLSRQASKVRVPGQLKKHYAPLRPTQLFSNLSELKDTSDWKTDYYIIHYSDLTDDLPYARKMSNNPDDYAQEIYAALRHAEHSAAKKIAVERPPNRTEWAAIVDRLSKSAS